MAKKKVKVKAERTPLKAIRAKCLECSNFQYDEVRLCPCTDCALYEYRMGHRPYKVVEGDDSEIDDSEFDEFDSEIDDSDSEFDSEDDTE